MFNQLTEYTIDYYADHYESAMEYVLYRNKQLLKFGFFKKNIHHYDDSICVEYEKDDTDIRYGAIYIYSSFRNKGLYMKRFKEHNFDMIVTLKECKIASYLEVKNIPYIELEHSNAYNLISEAYKDVRAKRSNVPYIYHIDEGGGILNYINADADVKDAYYLHPVFQTDEDFITNALNTDISEKMFNNVSKKSLFLAIEYRRVANSYLSHMDISNFVQFSCLEVKQMLIADKIQNYKDFLKYHYNSHPRSNELNTYFNNWFELLNINYNNYKHIIND